MQEADKIIWGYSISSQSQILLGLVRKFQNPDPRESWLLKLIIKYSNKIELTKKELQKCRKLSETYKKKKIKIELTLSTASGECRILFPVPGTSLGHKNVV